MLTSVLNSYLDVISIFVLFYHTATMDHSAPLVENIFHLPMEMGLCVQAASDTLVSGIIIQYFSYKILTTGPA